VAARHHSRYGGVGQLHNGPHHDRQRAPLLLDRPRDEVLADGEARVIDEQVDGAGLDLGGGVQVVGGKGGGSGGGAGGRSGGSGGGAGGRSGSSGGGVGGGLGGGGRDDNREIGVGLAHPHPLGDAGEVTGLGQIRGEDLHPHAGELPQLLGDGLQARPVAGDEDQIMVGLRQLPGQFQADAGSGPGNKCGSHKDQGSASGADRLPQSTIPQAPAIQKSGSRALFGAPGLTTVHRKSAQ